MTVEVIVPWRSGCPHRDAAWQWAGAQWASLDLDLTVTVAEAPPGEWCKAAAVTPAVRASKASIVVVADADVWCDRIPEAIQAVEDGKADWAVPHERVRRLNPTSAAQVLAGAHPSTIDDDGLDEHPRRGIIGGGIVILQASVANAVPLDPRFVGWGQEDHSWGYALITLAGEPWRGTSPLWHLWHPPQRRLSRAAGSHASLALVTRYEAAYRDSDAMAALVAEIPQEVPACP